MPPVPRSKRLGRAGTIATLAPDPDHGVEQVADRPQCAVSFVLPAYNEELNIVEAVQRTVTMARHCCSRFEVIVVDDGSSDATADLAAEQALHWPEVRVVRHGTNRGYGEALHTGFRCAQMDFVFFTDADNQFDMDDFGLLLEWADQAEVVAGYRKRRQDPPLRLLNAWAWNRMVRLLFYVPVRDIDCAFKLFRRSALDQLDIQSRGAMINTEIMVKLARAGCRIVEVGVSHRPRAGGTPQGAKPHVVFRAFREMVQMHPQLTTLGPSNGAVIDVRTDDSGARDLPLLAPQNTPVLLAGHESVAAR